MMNTNPDSSRPNPSRDESALPSLSVFSPTPAPILTVENPFDLIGHHSTPVDADLLDRTLNPVRLDSHFDGVAPASIGQRIHANRHPLSSMLVSLAAHLLILIVLMLLVYSIPHPERRISLLAEFNTDAVLEKSPNLETEKIKIELPEENLSPLEMNLSDLSTETEMEIADSSQSVINLDSMLDTPNVSPLETPAVTAMTLPTGGGLEGRLAHARSQLAAARGGSRESEIAVEQGIQWIIAHQMENGSWRFHHHKGPCNGRCSHPGTRESTTAATGLALLSLLGAGYTHTQGPYQQPVQQGLDYLVSRMRETKHGGILSEGEAGMYSHAIATIALAEAYTLSGDDRLAKPVAAARKYIVSAQHHKGGWRYNAGYPGDMTVTGWQLMALKSCQLAGFDTDPIVWKKAESFIDSLNSTSGAYGYQHAEDNNKHNGATTAVGLLSKMYLGTPRENGSLDLGANFIFDQGASKSDVYFNYYATQVMYHLQGHNWEPWNQAVREYLIQTQQRGNDHEAGSWFFEDEHGIVGGRLYTTTMAVMTLEVYYRYLPLYDEQAVLD